MENVSVETQIDEKEMNVLRLEEELNTSIGHFWWKSYINTAFWNNISTPLNLTITILTAITTGQTETDDLITKENMRTISMAALLITTLNTFFRPSTQLANAMDNMNSWKSLGNEFERIYLDTSETDYENREALMKELMKKVLDLRRNQKTNFLTDLIHLTSKALCIKNHGKWKK